MKIYKNNAGNVILSTMSGEIKVVIPSRQYLYLDRLNQNIIYISDNASQFSGVDNISVDVTKVEEAFGQPFEGNRDDLIRLLSEQFNSGAGGGEFNPSEHDLIEFKNVSVDPYVKVSSLSQYAPVSEPLFSNSPAAGLLSGDVNFVKGKDYNSLVNKPNLSAYALVSEPLFSNSPSASLLTADVTFVKGKDYNSLVNKPNLALYALVSEPVYSNSPAAGLVAGDITFVKNKDYNSLNNKPVIPTVAKQYGISFTKEFNNYMIVNTSMVVFDISPAGFNEVAAIFVSAQLTNASTTTAPLAVVTGNTLTSVTVNLLNSKTTTVVVGGEVEGLEPHALNNTKVFIRVIGN